MGLVICDSARECGINICSCSSRHEYDEHCERKVGHCMSILDAKCVPWPDKTGQQVPQDTPQDTPPVTDNEQQKIEMVICDQGHKCNTQACHHLVPHFASTRCLGHICSLVGSEISCRAYEPAGIETTPAGGKHSNISGKMTEVPPLALIEVARVMGEGAEKYPRDSEGIPNWHFVGKMLHLDHSLRHVANFLDMRNRPGTPRLAMREHLASFAARALMALDQFLREEEGGGK